MSVCRSVCMSVGLSICRPVDLSASPPLPSTPCWDWDWEIILWRKSNIENNIRIHRIIIHIHSTNCNRFTFLYTQSRFKWHIRQLDLLKSYENMSKGNFSLYRRTFYEKYEKVKIGRVCMKDPEVSWKKNLYSFVHFVNFLGSLVSGQNDKIYRNYSHFYYWRPS